VVTNWSNRSRTSSRAVTSWTLAKARRVAWRRGGDIRAMACARAAAAYRARAWTRTGGTAESLMEPTPRSRISRSRSNASTRPAILTRVGARRSRSKGDCREVSSATSKVSRRATCWGFKARARVRHNREAARSRTWATRRASTKTPCKRTLCSTSRAVARSRGRSVVRRRPRPGWRANGTGRRPRSPGGSRGSHSDSGSRRHDPSVSHLWRIASSHRFR
jgi:hypothetical protein